MNNSTETITISINGKMQSSAAQTISELLIAQGINPDQRGIAVAINGEIALRTLWDSIIIQLGDRIEIVHARSGG